ncbi:MAG: 4-(cytidine 5'-diphospho)-2-C-methyl-D-erythritol kinase [Candidatus Thiodiazotropha weberae]|nr:4-(cytidine 5'-diphospho)-2-C-methyl-D-erythritol kinase [Candidatus Thiodiazotropha weberae]MCW4190218.1 4-(cytidine 5'-diphospho)-2-C-methyl-D-erythritol kinase [Candidatus Thiodiazotropha weberae]
MTRPLDPTPESLSCPAPAKLNLMLRIVGRREDGYHDLQTVFQFIDRQDRLDFKHRHDGRIIITNPLPEVPEQQNLCFRAAKMLQQISGSDSGVELTLHKILPMGGGLGGGSSDAATTLVALNHLWGLGLGKDQLMEIGRSLGADVPIFIHGQAAWAEGVGDKMTHIELPEPWFLVLNPACHVSTAEVFGQPDLTRNSPRIKIRAFLEGNSQNDCLTVVRRRYPEVAQAMNWLDQYADARLTGTGACLFAEFAERQEADEVLDRLPNDLTGFVARGLNRSPLLDQFQLEKS